MGLNWEIGIDIYTLLCIKWAPLVAQTVKNLPAMQKIWVRSLGREDPLGKGIATYSSMSAWKIPWTDASTKQGLTAKCQTLREV